MLDSLNVYMVRVCGSVCVYSLEPRPSYDPLKTSLLLLL